MTLGNDNGTDGQTDGQTECDAICGPLYREEGRIQTRMMGQPSLSVTLKVDQLKYRTDIAIF